MSDDTIWGLQVILVPWTLEQADLIAKEPSGRLFRKYPR